MATIAHLIDEGLADAREQYATPLANTIDRQLAKPDVQLGLEYLLGFGPPVAPRRPRRLTQRAKRTCCGGLQE